MTTATPGNTLLLDISTWDLCADASGNIAMAAPPYAVAQDSASAVRTFEGEVYYDTTVGVPYFQQILGKRPPLALVKAQISAAALTVPGVLTAQTFVTSVVARQVSGQLQVTDSTGATSNVGF